MKTLDDNYWINKIQSNEKLTKKEKTVGSRLSFPFGKQKKIDKANLYKQAQLYDFIYTLYKDRDENNKLVTNVYLYNNALRYNRIAPLKEILQNRFNNFPQSLKERVNLDFNFEQEHFYGRNFYTIFESILGYNYEDALIVLIDPGIHKELTLARNRSKDFFLFLKMIQFSHY